MTRFRKVKFEDSELELELYEEENTIVKMSQSVGQERMKEVIASNFE